MHGANFASLIVLSSDFVSTRQKKNNPFIQLALPCICLMLCAYFMFHSLNGRFGFHSYNEANRTALELEFRLAAVKSQRQELEARVKLLTQGSIEKDMLDEQVRYHLNMVADNEIVLMRR